MPSGILLIGPVSLRLQERSLRLAKLVYFFLQGLQKHANMISIADSMVHLDGKWNLTFTALLKDLAH